MHTRTIRPEARVMKMADGGFRPAFNAQVAVVNTGSDMNEMVPMRAQIARRYGHAPERWLADGGFTKLQAVEHLPGCGTQPVLPPPKSRNPAINGCALAHDLMRMASLRMAFPA